MKSHLPVFIAPRMPCMKVKPITFSGKKIHLAELKMISCSVPRKGNQIQTVNNQ